MKVVSGCSQESTLIARETPRLVHSVGCRLASRIVGNSQAILVIGLDPGRAEQGNGDVPRTLSTQTWKTESRDRQSVRGRTGNKIAGSRVDALPARPRSSARHREIHGPGAGRRPGLMADAGIFSDDNVTPRRKRRASTLTRTYGRGGGRCTVFSKCT